jgi:ribosome-binding factor A
MSQRTEQLGSLIRRAVQDMLIRGLNDPRIRGLVSVTAVHVTDDLADATIDVSVLPAEHGSLTLHGLRHAAPHIRRELSRELTVRRIPRLDFRLDESLKKASEVYASLHEVRAEDPPDTPPPHHDELEESSS